MLASVVFVPSAPLLIPELAGPQADDTDAVRAQTLAAARELAGLATRWVAIGATDRDGWSSATRTGSFARFGVDVGVSLGPGTTETDGRLPLSMLIAGWLRAQSGADTVCPVIVDPDASPAHCTTLGREVAADIGTEDERIGILVVGDGATALTAAAPGGGRDEGAVALQARIDRALAAADVTTLSRLDPRECHTHGAVGRAPWQVAAALVDDRAMSPTLRYADAPFGVGYVVASWVPTGDQTTIAQHDV